MTTKGNDFFMCTSCGREGTQCVESYDFLRQYVLESGSRACWCTLSSKISAAPLSIHPIYRIGEQQVSMRKHMTVFWRRRSVRIVGGVSSERVGCTQSVGFTVLRVPVGQRSGCHGCPECR